jgi:hypothetical protein
MTWPFATSITCHFCLTELTLIESQFEREGREGKGKNRAVHFGVGSLDHFYCTACECWNRVRPNHLDEDELARSDARAATNQESFLKRGKSCSNNA